MAEKLARLELDFAPARRNAPLGWLLLAAGLVLATLAGVQFRSAHAERLAAADDLSVLTGRALPRALDPNAPGADPRASKAAAVVARDLQIPWSQMLAALESVDAKEVALLAVEPSASRHNIRITAEAKGLDAMLNYVQALRGDSFPEVSLASHQVQNNVPGEPVRFIVQARWKSP
jgi:hypothetical protein